MIAGKILDDDVKQLLIRRLYEVNDANHSTHACFLLKS